MIEEAAMLVIEDDQQRFLPLRAGGQRMVDGEHEFLAVLDVRRAWSSLGWKPMGLKLLKFGSIQATDGSVPRAASSRKLAASVSILTSSRVFQFRLVLLKNANLSW